MTRYIWMMVTQDKYELPVAVADSAEELATIVGTNKNNIYSTISHVKSGSDRHKFSKYVRVKFTDKDE